MSFPSNLKNSRLDPLVRHGYWVAVLVYTAVFFRLSYVRHDDLRSYYFDLGLFDHWVWSVLHGDGSVITARFGVHFDPILLVFVPLYAVFASPKVLLAVQSLALGLGAVPVYLIARDRFQEGWIPWVFMMSYLAHPALHYANLYDFHPVTLAVPLLGFAFYYMDRERYTPFLLLAGAAMLCKEQMGLVVFMFGIYMFVVMKNRRMGVAVSALGLTAFLVLMGWVLPAFSPTGKHFLMERYEWLGPTAGEAARTVVTHPWFTIKGVLNWDRAIHLLHLFGPLAVLPLLGAPALLVALPEFAINLLSANPMTYSIFFYHWATVLPFLYIAAAIGVNSVVGNNRRTRRAVAAYVGAATLLLFFYLSPMVPFSKNVWENGWSVSEPTGVIDIVGEFIPGKAALSVQNNLGAHFSQRIRITTFPKGVGEAEFVLVRVNNPYRHADRKESLEYALNMPVMEYASALRSIVSEGAYGVRYAGNGYFLFEKGYSGNGARESRALLERNLGRMLRSLE